MSSSCVLGCGQRWWTSIIGLENTTSATVVGVAPSIFCRRQRQSLPAGDAGRRLFGTEHALLLWDSELCGCRLCYQGRTDVSRSRACVGWWEFPDGWKSCWDPRLVTSKQNSSDILIWGPFAVSLIKNKKNCTCTSAKVFQVKLEPCKLIQTSWQLSFIYLFNKRAFVYSLFLLTSWP